MFRISRKPLIVQPSAAEDITLACAYLHNFLRRNSAAKQLHSPPGTLDFENTDDGTVLEECYEYNIGMHVLFIDFKQAFDSVDRQKIIQILQELRIPNKLVRLIKVTIQNMEASVKIKTLTSKPFLTLKRPPGVKYDPSLRFFSLTFLCILQWHQLL